MQGQFWPYHDLLFANQSDLSSSLYGQITQALDLDLSSFNTCFADNTFDSLVMQGIDDVNRYDIDATPYLFIGDTRINELTGLAELLQLVDQELLKLNTN